MSSEVQTLRQDPVAFISKLIDPATGRPFVLYPAEIEFLRAGLTPDADGRMPYPELVFSAIKKSGKTTLAAMVLLYVVCTCGESYAEGYCVANDEEQAQGRVFQAASRIVRRTPALERSSKVTASRIEFLNGATITAIASDYAGAAGGNPNISVFDELWGYTSERSQRLWDEMIPPPTRKVAIRLTVTYAGFEGESKLLESLYRRGLKGEKIATDLYAQPGLLMFWSHVPVAPWQTPAWVEQMRGQHRTNAFLRQIENRWVAGEEQFIPIEWWDRATLTPDAQGKLLEGVPRAHHVWEDRTLPVTLGIDAGLKRDSAAVVACTKVRSGENKGRIALVDHRIFYPPKGGSLDLEATLEEAVRGFGKRFRVGLVYYDPWQFARSAQTLAASGFKMTEFPQTLGNLGAMSSNLYELLKGNNLIAYPDPEIRLSLQRAVAVETPRGIKISKEKASHKIDVVVALAMSALAAVHEPTSYAMDYARMQLARLNPPPKPSEPTP